MKVSPLPLVTDDSAAVRKWWQRPRLGIAAIGSKLWMASPGHRWVLHTHLGKEEGEEPEKDDLAHRDFLPSQKCQSICKFEELEN